MRVCLEQRKGESGLPEGESATDRCQRSPLMRSPSSGMVPCPPSSMVHPRHARRVLSAVAPAPSPHIAAVNAVVAASVAAAVRPATVPRTD